MAAAPVWTDPRPVAVLGAGSALPGPSVETAELLARVDRRFGLELAGRGAYFADKLKIGARHLVRDVADRREAPRAGDSNPQLAARAVSAALDAAGLKPGDLSYLIGHTATPALPLPSNISLVADRLGYEGPHMELRQACTGFANALVVARALLSQPGCGPVAIVGSETGSVHFDPLSAAEDTGQLINLVMMGDGAGAVVLGPGEPNGGALSRVYLGQCGAGRAPGLSIPAGGSDRPWKEDGVVGFAHDFQHVRTTGPELFLRGAAALAERGADVHAADHVLPHQASGRIGEQFEAFTGLRRARVFVNADRLGNTGSAAIWLAFAELRERMRPGETLAVLGAEATKHLFGGFTYVHG